MKRAIVTGGAGFIGSNLVSLLLKKDFQVTVIDNLSVGSVDNLDLSNKKLKFIKEDVENKKAMIRLIKGHELVFHLAVQCIRKSIKDPFSVHETNATGTLNVLEASSVNKIKKFIYVSSSEIYGSALTTPMTESHPLNPTTVYGASKLVGEYYSLAYLRTYGLPVVIARPFNSYGYNEHFEGVYGEVIPRFIIRALNNLSLQVFGNGKQTRDFTFVEDTAMGLLLLSKKGKIGEIYNLARGEEVSIKKLASLIIKILNKKVIIENLAQRPGDITRLFAKVTKAKKEFGFVAKNDIETGLAKYLDWFIKKHQNPKKLLKYYVQNNW